MSLPCCHSFILMLEIEKIMMEHSYKYMKSGMKEKSEAIDIAHKALCDHFDLVKGMKDTHEN